jgi:hypothetical protein
VNSKPTFSLRTAHGQSYEAGELLRSKWIADRTVHLEWNQGGKSPEHHLKITRYHNELHIHTNSTNQIPSQKKVSRDI